MRKLEVVFVAVGTLLLGVYLVPTLYGVAMSHLAILKFRSQSVSNSRWDSARIQAYQRTLLVPFASPEAVLRIPKVGIEVPLLEGVSDLTLNRGVGHVPGTSLPGEPGNLVIAGHRDGFFRGLKDLTPGDYIDVQRLMNSESVSPAQRTDRYVVRAIKVVFPSDLSVLNQTSDSTLTLITCFPFYYVGSAPQRYIVQASLMAVEPRMAQAN